jgi:hypothetical protein
LDEKGAPVEAPADQTSVLNTAVCCAICNDSSLGYDAGTAAASPQLLSSSLVLLQVCKHLRVKTG